MVAFTVQAVYEKGVLRPCKKLNLPERCVVEIRVKRARALKEKTKFASLIGIWEGKNAAALEKSLASARKKSASKIKKLAKALT